VNNSVSLILLFVALATQAQTITHDSLLGTWDLQTLHSNVLHVDFQKDSTALIDNPKATPKQKEMQRLLTGLLNEELAGVEGSITFTHTTFALKTRLGHTENYSLQQHGGKTILVTDTDTIAVQLENNMLQLTWQVKGMPATLTFTKGTAAAAPQPIAPQDLLGEWHPVYIVAKGCTYNYKTGAVTLPESITARAIKEGQDIEGLKAKLAQALRSAGFADTKIIFSQGNVLEWQQGGKVETARYTLTKKGGAIYLKRPDGRTLKVDFKDGYFYILKDTDNGSVTQIVFEKQ
jgi:hypothetical protein